MNKRLLAPLVGFVLVLALSAVVHATALLPQDIDPDGALVILHINDSHGRLLSSESQVGFYQVSGIKNELQAAGATVLLLDSGDTLHGLPIATLRQGADIVAIMNAMGFSATAPGNHDFNYGQARLHELNTQMQFPVLAANVVDTDGQLVFDANTVLEAGGLRVGLFGLATQDTPIRTHPNNVAGLSFTDPAEAAVAQVAALQEAGAELIIALSHVGVDESTPITSDMVAAATDGLHILLDGHSHVAIQQSTPRREDIRLAPHSETVLASTGGYMAQLGLIVVKDNTITSRLIDPSAELPIDTELQAMITELVAAQDEILSEVVGHTDVALDGVRGRVRTTETNLGNLCANALMAFTAADVAITNGGGIRDSIAAGPITRGDLITVFPFGNYVVTLDVPGTTLLEVLEHSVSLYPAEAGSFLQIAGMSLTFDPEAEPGSRITSVQVGGEPLQPNASYVLATNDFLAGGGDGYTMLNGLEMVGMFSAMEDVMIDYITNNPSFAATIGEAGRIVAAVAQASAAGNTDEEDMPENVEVTDMTLALEPIALPQPEAPGMEQLPEPIISAPTPHAPVQHDQPRLPAGDAYVVADGDSLYKIAGRVLGDSSRWSEIYQLNSGLISQPHIIQVGWELVLPK